MWREKRRKPSSERGFAGILGCEDRKFCANASESIKAICYHQIAVFRKMCFSLRKLAKKKSHCSCIFQKRLLPLPRICVFTREHALRKISKNRVKYPWGLWPFGLDVIAYLPSLKGTLLRGCLFLFPPL